MRRVHNAPFPLSPWARVALTLFAGVVGTVIVLRGEFGATFAEAVAVGAVVGVVLAVVPRLLLRWRH